MPTYNIRGINVNFPFDAYDCQLTYMAKVIESLQQGCNALLESPTGTGKTLCLLCASLAWRKSLGNFTTGRRESRSGMSSSQPSSSQTSEHERSKFPVIVYASRTHSQLKQVIRELKATSYRPKMAVLGSREQMCVHDEVRLLRGRTQNNACNFIRKKGMCRHQSGVSEYLKNHHELGNEPFDIEDLVNIGRNHGPCPYYLSRELHKDVDILFAPYNYLIDPGNRKSLSGIDWSNAVLIFDEAHNLESICADAASFDLPSGLLTTCISEAKQCIDLCVTRRVVEKSADTQFDPENYAILRALLLKLEKRITEVDIKSKESGFTQPGNYIYDFLSEMNITSETANMLIGTIDNASLLLDEGNISAAKTNSGCRLEIIRDILEIIFRDGSRGHSKFYQFHVQESQTNIADSVKGKTSRTLSWWCFHPGLAMQEFLKLGVRSIILTSGTLSPLDSLAQEMNLEFPIRLENPHVISPDQIWVGVVPNGPSGCTFNSSYRNRDSLDYKQELGNAIVNFARIVPDGLLVFFPSYYTMDQCLECWKSRGHAKSTDFSTIWERICKYKQPVVEPKQSSLFPHAIEDFEAKLRDKSTSGAIFFAVCRGKVSEGLDFADQAGRAVIVTGMPFSLKTDPKVRLKREYLDNQTTSSNGNAKALTGEEWYVQQAARAVNQSVGRVIRHRHDYGAIIFCDERFAKQNWQLQMSYWLRPYVKCYPKFGDIVLTLTRFFRDRATLVSLKPKVVNSGISLVPREKSVLLNDLKSSDASANHCFGVPSGCAATKKNLCNNLAAITPANRSSVPYSRSFDFTFQNRRQNLNFEKRLEATERKRNDTQYQDSEVVDLACSPTSLNQMTEDVLAPFAKKSKVQVSATECGALTSSKWFEKFRGSTGDDMQAHPAQVKEISQKQPSKAEDSSNRCKPNQENKGKGSAFLTQVEEKLTAEEYKEFVNLMKAMKAKTMEAKFVMDSIARLFCAPGRSSLYERFKDFVPPKYLPLYELCPKAYGEKDNE